MKLTERLGGIFQKWRGHGHIGPPQTKKSGPSPPPPGSDAYGCRLNTGSDCSDGTRSAEEFQNREAATGKARSPMDERRVSETTVLLWYRQYIYTVCLYSLSVQSVLCHVWAGADLFCSDCSNINSVPTCTQFAVVPYHFWIFKFWKTVSPTGCIRSWKRL